MNVGVNVDMQQLQEFYRENPSRLEHLKDEFYEVGGLYVESLYKLDVSKRVGVETSESNMQHPDAGRPKGFLMNSVIPIRVDDGVEVGPEGLAYAGWAVEGSESPEAPASHKSSQFRGHRFPDHVAAEAPEYLNALMDRLLLGHGVV